jgi:uncharacterized membrane protein required for colicin V production
LCFHGPLATWFSEHTRLTGRAAAALAFVLSVLAAAGCMIGLRLLVKRVMHVVVEPGVDKFLGCFAGLLRAGVLVVIVFLSMNLLPHDYLNRLFGADSIIGAAVLRFAPMGPPGEIPPLEDGQPGEMPRANERKR